jgi:pimeloyl-ACP methyl ester carboxylesterase
MYEGFVQETTKVSACSPSCGHFLMEEAPAEVAAALEDFLRQHALQA